MGAGRLSPARLYSDSPLLVLIMASLERRGLGLLRGLWPRPRQLPSCPGQRRCYRGPHCWLPDYPPPASSTWGHPRTQSGSCPSVQQAYSVPHQTAWLWMLRAGAHPPWTPWNVGASVAAGWGVSEKPPWLDGETPAVAAGHRAGGGDVMTA